MDTQILKTSSPYEELEKYAKDNKVDFDLLDFKVLNYQTIVKKGKEEKTYGVDELSYFNNDDNYLDCDSIEQEYEIMICKKILPLIEFKIGSNKKNTKLVAHFTTNNYDEQQDIDEVLENIMDLINKRLIKQGFLLGIRQFDFKEQLTKALKLFNTKKTSEAKILISKGVDLVETQDSKTIHYYKDKKEVSEESKKIDYSQRGFITSVSKDELIIEFIKPIQGKNGKNLRGQTINTTITIKTPKPDFRIGKNIRMQEEENSIKYYSNTNGYISYSNSDKLYDVKDSVNVQIADFKTTGSIDAGINKDVTLNVEEDDKLKDAIGANLTIEVSVINVKGNVAQNSTIIAKEANIGGQTHSKSKIYAENINISVHKGYCEGDYIIIDKLEGGVIVGKNVQVKQALGGKIIANKIRINTLTTNTKIESGELVIINECLGENNKIIMSVSKSPLVIDSLNKILKGLQECDRVLLSLPKSLENKKLIIDSNKESITQIKEKIQEMKQANITPPAPFFTKIKEFQKTVNEYNELSLMLKDTLEKQKYLRHNLNLLENKIYEAKVVNIGTWSNLNEIKFTLLHPETELVYNTKEGEEIYCLKLEKVVLNGKENPEIVKRNRTEVGDFDHIEIIEGDFK